MELTEDTEFKQISYLLSGSSIVFPTSCIKFKSYLNLHLASVAEHHNLKLPKCFTNRSVTCPYCYFPWSYDTTSIKLFPSKKSVTGKKYTSNLSDIDKEKVASCEFRNKLVLKCKVCCKKSSFSLLKKWKLGSEKAEIFKSNTIVKKKKKKKDKTCGIKINLVPPDSEIVSQSKKNSFNKHDKSRKSLNTDVQTAGIGHSLSVNKPKVNRVPNFCLDKTNIKTKHETTRKLVLNPFSSNFQQKLSNKKKMLHHLNQAAKEDKGSVKNTLKDFLSLVAPQASD